MSATGKPLQPIIIKRIKKAGHGAHGGAWKIAYADFVTAMMAFFLLLWLLGSTTEDERRGIGEFFSQPFVIALTGGEGAGETATILPGGGQDLTQTEGEQGPGANMPLTPQPSAQELAEEQLRQAQLTLDRERIENLRGQIERAIGGTAAFHTAQQLAIILVAGVGVQRAHDAKHLHGIVAIGHQLAQRGKGGCPVALHRQPGIDDRGRLFGCGRPGPRIHCMRRHHRVPTDNDVNMR